MVGGNLERGGGTQFVHGRSRRPSHDCYAGTERVGFSPTKQTLLAPSAKRREVFGGARGGGNVGFVTVRKRRDQILRVTDFTVKAYQMILQYYCYNSTCSTCFLQEIMPSLFIQVFYPGNEDVSALVIRGIGNRWDKRGGLSSHSVQVPGLN